MNFEKISVYPDKFFKFDVYIKLDYCCHSLDSGEELKAQSLRDYWGLKAAAKSLITICIILGLSEDGSDYSKIFCYSSDVIFPEITYYGLKFINELSLDYYI